jgi:antitoxin (DNA-binding transcriptional repressor) of toxin-antitoxin stability system
VIGMLDHVPVNEAENYLFRLLADVDTGGEIAITRNGRPVATVTQPPPSNARSRVRGVWKGQVDMSRFDDCDDEIAREFGILE